MSFRELNNPPESTRAALATEEIQQTTENLSMARNVTGRHIKNFVARKSVLARSLTVSIKKVLFDRGIFRYNLGNILHYVFCCASCKRVRQLAKNSNFYRSHMLYDEGEEKLQEELDCITFLKSIRQLKLLTQVLLTRKQKLMLRF